MKTLFVCDACPAITRWPVSHDDLAEFGDAATHPDGGSAVSPCAIEAALIRMFADVDHAPAELRDRVMAAADEVLNPKGSTLKITHDCHLNAGSKAIAAAVVRELVEVNQWTAETNGSVVSWQGHLGTARHVQALIAAFASRTDPDREALAAVHAQLLTAAGAA